MLVKAFLNKVFYHLISYLKKNIPITFLPLLSESWRLIRVAFWFGRFEMTVHGLLIL